MLNSTITTLIMAVPNPAITSSSRFTLYPFFNGTADCKMLTYPIAVSLRFYLELPSIGWQLFILDNSQSDPIALPAFLDTYATRLLTEPLTTSCVHIL